MGRRRLEEALTPDEADRVASVYEAHRPYIESVARRHAFRPDHVPDIVQSVGVQVCRGLTGFRGESQLETWLYRVTVNVARDFYHRERRQERAAEAVASVGLADDSTDPDDNAMVVQRLEALRDAVERLRPLHREAIYDRVRNHIAADSVEDDQKEGTRKSRLFRARKQLRTILENDPRFRGD